MAITLGNEQEFLAASADCEKIIYLTTTKVAVFYKGGLSYGKCKIGDISGGVITWGSEQVFYAGAVDNIAVAKLSDTAFVVGFYTTANSYNVAIVGAVSGTTVTWGNAAYSNSGGSGYTTICALSSTSFVMGYARTSQIYSLRPATISGTNITWGTEDNNISGTNLGTQGVSLQTLSSARFAIAYGLYNGSAYIGKTRVGDVSANTITLRAGVNLFSSGSMSYSSGIAVLSSIKYVVCASKDSANNVTVVCDVSGDTVVPGSEQSIGSTRATSSSGVASVALNSTKFTVVVNNTNVPNTLLYTGAVNGTTVTLGNPATIKTDAIFPLAIDKASESDWAIAYRDTTASNHGQVVLANEPSALPFIPKITII